MKKILATLFFLGMATTGFAQWEINFAGNASLEVQGDKMLIVTCNGEGTCARIIGSPNGEVHLLIPAYKLDLVLTPATTVNSVPVSSLPPQMPNGTYTFNWEIED